MFAVTLRRAACAAVMAGVLAGAPAAAGAATPPLGLGDYAAARGKLIGTAVDPAILASEPAYKRTLKREFTSITPENAMKWESVEPRRGQLDFTAADRLVRFAARQGDAVRGHTLVWHSQLPAWLTQGNFSKTELKSILRRHVTDEARHFRGRIYAWDVVNEPFNDDGTWRDTIWYRALGPEYVADALEWAHEADPGARLYINDYNVESIGPKSNAMYALAQDLQSRDVPLDGIGFQAHLDLLYGFPDSFGDNLKRFAALHLDVAITEADVRITLPVTPEQLERQADYFAGMMDACLAVRRCVSYTAWGITDAHSWVPSVFPGEGAALLFDEHYAPKPAYYALRDQLLSR